MITIGMRSIALRQINGFDTLLFEIQKFNFQQNHVPGDTRQSIDCPHSSGGFPLKNLKVLFTFF